MNGSSGLVDKSADAINQTSPKQKGKWLGVWFIIVSNCCCRKNEKKICDKTKN